MFWFAKGKLRRVYDESLDAAQELQRGEAGLFKLEAIDFGRRVSIEKEIDSCDAAACVPNAVFDGSGNFIIYATLLGIKVLHFLLARSPLCHWTQTCAQAFLLPYCKSGNHCCLIFLFLQVTRSSTIDRQSFQSSQ